MASKAEIKASAEYNKRNTVQVALRINVNTETDILNKLNSVPNKMRYIKDLIRKDIKESKENNMYNINDLTKNEELFEEFMERLNSSKFAGVETVNEFLDRFDQLNTSRTVYSLINGRFEDGCIDEELHEQVGHDGYVEVEGYEQVELAPGRFVKVYGKAGFDKWSEDYNEYQECGFGDFDRIELA